MLLVLVPQLEEAMLRRVLSAASLFRCGRVSRPSVELCFGTLLRLMVCQFVAERCDVAHLLQRMDDTIKPSKTQWWLQGEQDSHSQRAPHLPGFLGMLTLEILRFHSGGKHFNYFYSEWELNSFGHSVDISGR